MLTFLKWLAGLILAGYLAVAALAYFFQERLIFHPRAQATDYVYDWGREVAVPVASDVDLSTVWVDKPDERGVVLYFHGNVGDNNRGLYQMSRVMALPYDVVFVDYRGFGKSGGAPESDLQLLADVQAVYDRVKQALSRRPDPLARLLAGHRHGRLPRRRKRTCPPHARGTLHEPRRHEGPAFLVAPWGTTQVSPRYGRAASLMYAALLISTTGRTMS